MIKLIKFISNLILKLVDFLKDRERKASQQKITSSQVNNGVVINININDGKK